jgi:methylphosphotriester-DNA--protein-cysteine methyltransferase
VRKRAASTRPARRAVPRERSGRPRTPRAQAIRRVWQFLERSGKRPVQLSELCRVSGVRERTLRSIFLEVFGLSPMRYLRARKLHAVRVELALAEPRFASVSAIAKRMGVTDVGRMARDYQALFGEYPSATLERRLALRARRR